ncbi:MAG: ATP-binding protein [Sphaerochaeta sp.]
MIKRNLYLDKLIALKDTQSLIKVITGVRRSGKSALLILFKEFLLESGIQEEDILWINFEDIRYLDIDNAKALHDLVISRLGKGPKQYILLDEVQLVPDWEKAVNSLRLKNEHDLYITGSNATLLSGSLATLLSGRYIEIRVFPLSFQEFLSFHYLEALDRAQAFQKYLTIGGMPGLKEVSESMQQEYLSAIIDTIVRKDIYANAQIRDEDILTRIIIFLAANVGNPITTQNIATYFASVGKKTTADTIDTYLNYLEEAFIFVKARRFNIKDKSLMKTNNKFYIIDIGLRNALQGIQDGGVGAVLENIVFLELLRRGYTVSVGKFQEWEVDFIAEKPNTRLYIQVSASILDEKTREREIRPLREIQDSYPKLLLTMDSIPFLDFEGIQHRNIIDFLLQKE